MRRAIEQPKAFTILELLVLAAVLGITAAMLLMPTGHGTRANPKRIQCINNLKNVGLAYRIFATDHDEMFPWQRTTNSMSAANADEAFKTYLILSNNISTPNIFACPADTRKPAADLKSISRTNISYFLGLNSAADLPNSFLAGDRNITTNGTPIGPGTVTLRATTNLSWDARMHKLQGNVAMGDGSVQQLSSARLRDQARNTGLNELRLAVP